MGGTFLNVDGDGNVDERIKLINNAFANVFSLATLSITAVEEIKQTSSVGHLSTCIRLLTNKDGDLLAYLDKIDAS